MDLVQDIHQVKDKIRIMVDHQNTVNMVNHEVMENQDVMEDHHTERTAVNIMNHLRTENDFEI
jgi:hypothetical protein